jgi:CubicO group peptidase (beta-lactamase class C family)
MFRSKRVIPALAALLLIAALPRAESLGPQDIDTFIVARMQATRIPGLALGVVQADRIAYLKGYGVAEPDGRPVTPHTPFILGSTSKSFTALAVMQLVEAAKIDLDSPVTTYLPWFRTHDMGASDTITVRHLLHHTSGLAMYEGRQGLWDGDQSSLALENGVRQLSGAKLRQPPGRRYEYSNENYNTLGLIVAAVSGMSYEDYVRSAIFNPLRMTHSAAALSDPAAADVASGSRYWLLWPLGFDAPYPRRMTPSGFLISSAEDLTYYLAAQLDGGTYEHSQVLSRHGIDTHHAPVASMGPSSSYGMGWVVTKAAGSTRIWHDGDVSNFYSHLLLLPELHLGIVVLMNVGAFGHTAAINGLVEGITATLLGHGQAVPANSLATALSPLTMLVPLLIATVWAVWAVWSLRSPRRWRLYLPLVIDVCLIGVIWIVVPARSQTPMATIALFAPDAFAVLVTITGLVAGCAIARTFIALRSRQLRASPADHALAG